MFSDEQLHELSMLIREDTELSDAIRAKLGLVWQAGPSAQYPSRRLVTPFRPISRAAWRKLRDAS